MPGDSLSLLNNPHTRNRAWARSHPANTRGPCPRTTARDSTGAKLHHVITKRILDEKPGLAKSQPKIEVADSMQLFEHPFLDDKAL